MKQLLIKHKTKFIIGTIGLLLVIILIILFFNFEDKKTKIDNNLKKLGEKFYTTFYYQQVSNGQSEEDKNAFLKKYEKIGIKVNISNLERYNNNQDKDIIDKLTYKGKACDKETTMAVIYPKEPYGQMDYTMGTILDCGIEEKTSANK